MFLVWFLYLMKLDVRSFLLIRKISDAGLKWFLYFFTLEINFLKELLYFYWWVYRIKEIIINYLDNTFDFVKKSKVHI